MHFLRSPALISQPPTKRQELDSLCAALRAMNVPFAAISRTRRGEPDLIVADGKMAAIWVRRTSDRGLSDLQEQQTALYAKAGATVILAFGVEDALQSLAKAKMPQITVKPTLKKVYY